MGWGLGDPLGPGACVALGLEPVAWCLGLEPVAWDTGPFACGLWPGTWGQGPVAHGLLPGALVLTPWTWGQGPVWPVACIFHFSQIACHMTSV